MKKILSRRAFKGLLMSSIAATSGISKVKAKRVVDVTIVGAGLSGLYSALLLESFGLKTLVLEGRPDRVGGRVYTLYDIPSQPEAGGEIFGPMYARCIDMIDKLGLKTRSPRIRSQAEKENYIYNIRNQMIRLDKWESHEFNPFPDSLKGRTPWEIFYNDLSKDNPMVSLDDWVDVKFKQNDISFAKYLKLKGFNDEAIRLLEVNSAYGNTLYDVSTLHLQHYYTWMVQNGKIKKRTQIDGGNQKLPEGMRGLINGDLLLGKKVVSIENSRNSVEVRTSDDEVYKSRFCICTLPFSILRNINVETPLSGLQRQAVETLPYYSTYQIHYEILKPYWEIDGMPQSMWSDGSIGRANVLTDEYDKNKACLLLYINGLQAQYLDRMTMEDAEKFIRSELIRIRPSIEGSIKLLRVHSNQRDPYIAGSYAYWKPGAPTTLPMVMSKPHGRLHFAGEHTSISSRGMEGAMESAERVVSEILQKS